MADTPDTPDAPDAPDTHAATPTVTKIDAADPLARSRDLAAENRRKLAALFPGLLTETADGPAVDADALRDLVGATVDRESGGTPEKFGLSWHGKAAARRLALTPSAAALRPRRAASVDFDATANVLIEGDNLEVLKLLGRSCAGRVKLIYIDPPYNTGKDFVYKDDFRDPVGHYLRLTGQTGAAGEPLTSNAETGGRFHTDWLNMIYPRLLLARELLREDGIIFVSIDDHEVHHLRAVMDEVFGSECFLADAVWQKKYSPANDVRNFSDAHDTIIIYARTPPVDGNGNQKSIVNRLPRTEKNDKAYKDVDEDPRGRWKAGDYTCAKSAEERPNLYYAIKNPNTGEEIWPKKSRVWAASPEKFEEHAADGRIYWGTDGKSSTPIYKRFLDEVPGMVPTTWWPWEECSHTDAAKKEVGAVFPDVERLFDTPKPLALIKRMLALATSPEGDPNGDPHLILDFFAGSGTTGHAVMEQNAADGGNRRFVLVQLPEPTGRAAYPTIADLTAERLRRAGARIKDEGGRMKDDKQGALLPGVAGSSFSPQPSSLDTGFRVFALDAANVRAWAAPATDALAPGEAEQLIRAGVDAVVPGRSAEDLLWGAILTLGLPGGLAGRVEQRSVGGRAVYVAGAGDGTGLLLACFDEGRIDLPAGEALAAGLAGIAAELGARGEVTVLLRDAAFAGRDAAKVNLAENLKQRMPEGATARVRSL